MISIVITLSDDQVEAVARHAAQIVLTELDSRMAAEATSRYVSVTEAAAILRSRPQRVYDLVSAGRLRRYKDGRRLLIDRGELEEHLAHRARRR